MLRIYFLVQITRGQSAQTSEELEESDGRLSLLSAQQTHPVRGADAAKTRIPRLIQKNKIGRGLSGAPSLPSPSELGAYLR